MNLLFGMVNRSQLILREVDIDNILSFGIIVYPKSFILRVIKYEDLSIKASLSVL